MCSRNVEVNLFLQKPKTIRRFEKKGVKLNSHHGHLAIRSSQVDFSTITLIIFREFLSDDNQWEIRVGASRLWKERNCLRELPVLCLIPPDDRLNA